MTAEQGFGGMSFGQTVVLYDGVCGLCNWLVAFLIRHDRRDQFRFAPLQSETARKLLHRFGLNAADFDSVVVIANFQRTSEHALTRSEAVLWCVRQLGGIWGAFAIAKLIPAKLRERICRFVARRRYRIFGKYDTCPLPRAEDRHKFLDGD